MRGCRAEERAAARARRARAARGSPSASLRVRTGCVPPRSLRHSHGVNTSATASEISMPMLELIGIGLMYGPISPLTNAIGRSAAITVKVARIVGPPTSSTARGMISASVPPPSAHVPMDVLDDDDRVVDENADREDQREQRDAIDREPPRPGGEQRRRERRRAPRHPTTTASRRPIVSTTSSTTEAVANSSFSMSFMRLVVRGLAVVARDRRPRRPRGCKCRAAARRAAMTCRRRRSRSRRASSRPRCVTAGACATPASPRVPRAGPVPNHTYDSG